jgi:hypothetical protein
LCDAELAIRGDAANGVPFEAWLEAADAHLAVGLEGGVMFLADDGQRYEGSVQNAFTGPQHGVLLQGALMQPRKGLKYELWHSATECTTVFLHESDRSSRQLKPADAKVIWEVEAHSYQEALQRRNEYFRSLERSGNAAFDQDTSTTRFTMGMYLGADGEERSLAVPGWVGMVPAFLEANIAASQDLGQMYFERPGRSAPLDMAEFRRQVLARGMREITVVDLRSTKASERMCQEFYGRMEDPERIHHMVLRRLGSDLLDWTIVEAHVLRLSADDERT